MRVKFKQGWAHPTFVGGAGGGWDHRWEEGENAWCEKWTASRGRSSPPARYDVAFKGKFQMTFSTRGITVFLCRVTQAYSSAGFWMTEADDQRQVLRIFKSLSSITENVCTQVKSFLGARLALGLQSGGKISPWSVVPSGDPESSDLSLWRSKKESVKVDDGFDLWLPIWKLHRSNYGFGYLLNYLLHQIKCNNTGHRFENE